MAAVRERDYVRARSLTYGLTGDLRGTRGLVAVAQSVDHRDERALGHSDHQSDITADILSRMRCRSGSPFELAIAGMVKHDGAASREDARARRALSIWSSSP